MKNQKKTPHPRSRRSLFGWCYVSAVSNSGVLFPTDPVYYGPTFRAIWYDTVDLRVLKSWPDGQLNPAHGTEMKNKEN